jgi:hypothetical protein
MAGVAARRVAGLLTRERRPAALSSDVPGWATEWAAPAAEQAIAYADQARSHNERRHAELDGSPLVGAQLRFVIERCRIIACSTGDPAKHQI